MPVFRGNRHSGEARLGQLGEVFLLRLEFPSRHRVGMFAEEIPNLLTEFSGFSFGEHIRHGWISWVADG